MPSTYNLPWKCPCPKNLVTIPGQQLLHAMLPEIPQESVELAPCPICSSRMMGVSKLTEEEGKIRQKRKEEFRGKVDDIFFLVFPGHNSIEYQQRYWYYRAWIQYTFGWSTEQSIEMPNLKKPPSKQLFSPSRWIIQMVLLNWKAFERDF